MMPMTPRVPVSSALGVMRTTIFSPLRSMVSAISLPAERWMDCARSSQPASARPSKSSTRSSSSMPALSAGKPTIRLPMTGSLDATGMPLSQTTPVNKVKAST